MVEACARAYNREVTSNLFFSRTGSGKEIETLINEEALVLSMHLRNEKEDWIPRIGVTQ